MKRILMLAVAPVLLFIGSVQANELSIAPEMLTEAKAVSHVAAPDASVAENSIELTGKDGNATDACYFGGYYGCYYPSYSWCYPVYRCYTSYYCYPYSCFNYYCGHWCW